MFNKPWHYFGVKYEEHFWNAAKDTPYYESLLTARSEYTDKKREADMKGAGKLIEATVDIMRDKCSFCHVIGENFFKNSETTSKDEA